MSARRVRQRALAAMAQDLADSDPRLDELFRSFNRRAIGRKMPATERIRTGPLGWITRFGAKAGQTSGDFDRISDWWL